MNRVVWFIRGYLVVTIQGAYPGRILNRLTAARIPFWDLQWCDEFTIQFCLFPGDFNTVSQTAEQIQCQVEMVQRGLPVRFRAWLHRPMLWFWIGLTCLSALVVPSFLLWYEVEGSEIVPDAQILRTLEELDVGFGTYGPSINPRWIKDHVLNIIPQLQWITVTQNGCMAQVAVRERPQTPETIDRRGYANVIATQPGLITSQSVLAGQAVRKPGDIVLEGELLVSGLVNLERVFTMEYAQAEVFARTWRKKTVVIPDTCLLQTGNEREFTAVWLEIGKKRIKIFGNSGISTASCDKMINRKILSLPGGLELPASLLIERCVERQMTVCTADTQAAEDAMLEYVRNRAMSDMRAGTILFEQAEFVQKDGCYQLSTVLTCHEMIAETVEAKWNEKDFQHDGKNG